MIRFHLDEHVDHDIARGLIRRGVDVTTATDVGLLGADDEVHVAFALREKRVLLKHDADFLRLARAGVDHGGILYCPPQRRSVGYLVRYLFQLAQAMTPEEFHGRVDFV